MLNRLASARQLGLAGIIGRVKWRASQVLRIAQFRWLRRRFNPNKLKAENLGTLFESSPNYLAPAPSIVSILRGDECISDRDRQRIRRLADLVCNDHVELRGIGDRKLSFERGNWYCYDAEAALMLNRHDFLVPLVQAYVVFGDDRYLHKLGQLFRYWIDEFNLERMIRHDTPIDAGIRLLNWLWVIHFGLVTKLGLDLSRLLHSIVIQLEYIQAWSSAGGNHLVLESLAAYAYGVQFASIDPGQRMQHWGRKNLDREILREVTRGGVHTEQSMFYHRIVATHFLKFHLIAQRNNKPLSADQLERLESMLDYVHDTLKPDLTHPVIGDGDLMVTDDREHWEAGTLLAARDLLFGKAVFRPFRASLNDAVIWFLGKDVSAVSSSDDFPPSRVLVDSGMAVLRHLDDYVLFDAAPFGDPEFPHHGHADALSVEVALGGGSLFLDPGGYGYHDDAMRHYFRSTRAHNTLAINGLDQSQLYGVFGYGRLAQVELSDWAMAPDVDFVAGHHDGYRPFVHVRQVYLRKGERRYLLIIDFVNGPTACDVELVFHAAPGQRVKTTGGTMEMMSDGDRVGSGLWAWASDALTQTVAHGQDESGCHGWVSTHTSEVIPADVWRRHGRIETPFVAATLVAAGGARIDGLAYDSNERLLTVPGDPQLSFELNPEKMTARIVRVCD